MTFLGKMVTGGGTDFPGGTQWRTTLTIPANNLAYLSVPIPVGINTIYMITLMVNGRVEEGGLQQTAYSGPIRCQVSRLASGVLSESSGRRTILPGGLAYENAANGYPVSTIIDPDTVGVGYNNTADAQITLDVLVTLSAGFQPGYNIGC